MEIFYLFILDNNTIKILRKTLITLTELQLKMHNHPIEHIHTHIPKHTYLHIHLTTR